VVPWPGGVQQLTFTLRLQTPGQAATVHLVVRRDSCPDWPTFIGAGPAVFLTPLPTPSPPATLVTPTATPTRSVTTTATPTRSPMPTPTATLGPCLARVCAWGSNIQGQLGEGTTSERHTPVTVSGLTTAVALAAGEAHSLALLADGTVRAWGANAHGQLGDGSTIDRYTAVLVSVLAGVGAIGGGGFHSLALRASGPGCGERGVGNGLPVPLEGDPWAAMTRRHTGC
jgi:hypothetical protein